MDILQLQSFIKAYIQSGKRHDEYKETISMYKEIKVHADGETPDKILLERRPGESKYIFDYRTKIYQPKTKRVVHKIINTLSMINRSVDWAIKYDPKGQPTRLGENTLQKYCEEDYPMFGSLTNWLFSICLKQYLIDPNAVALVRYNSVVGANEYAEPVIEIFNSDDVYDYSEENYVILESEEKAEYTVMGKKYTDGKVYWVVTPDMYYKVLQNGKGNTDWRVEETPHTAGCLPAFKLGGLIKETDQEFLYESRIGGIVPSLNTAVSLYSDKQAEIVQHVHSLMWQYQTQKCGKCNGLGTVKPSAESAPIACTDCKGHGTVPTSPYESLVINANTSSTLDKDVPIPMAGYIQKNDVSLMLKAMSEEIKQEIFDAYSAVNMEHLADTPLAQSGTAKAMDGDSLNNFVFSVACDLVNILKNSYYIIAKLRYGYQITDEKVIMAMQPIINTPQKFDLLSSNYIVDEIARLRESKVDASIIGAVETEFISKKFKDNTDVQQLIKASFSLNPFHGISEDEKMARLNSGGIDQNDYIISCYITPFIRRAIQENANFYELPETKQYEILTKYAIEKRNAISGVSDIKNALATDATQSMGNTLANSVGGLTGMIEIVKAVASGVYDLDAAVSLVANRFGISEEEARKQLGSPQIIQSQTDATVVQKLT
mgnify:CR=1 FL=1